jgi:two-component system, OmpR family, response regulator ChvI
MATIAIVNNEKLITEALARSLRDAGYEVRVYDRTDVALDALLAEPADLAFLDRTNPPLGGVELFRRLRQHTDMPVVFLSSWAEELQDELAGSGLEADDYIDAPFSLAHVHARAKAILSRPPKLPPERQNGA